jgi:hypothetical protein
MSKDESAPKPGAQGRIQANDSGFTTGASKTEVAIAQQEPAHKGDASQTDALPPAVIHGPSVVGRSCTRCGSESFLATRGTPPHFRRLDCPSCGTFSGWLPKRLAGELSRLS